MYRCETIVLESSHLKHVATEAELLHMDLAEVQVDVKAGTLKGEQLRHKLAKLSEATQNLPDLLEKLRDLSAKLSVELPSNDGNRKI